VVLQFIFIAASILDTLRFTNVSYCRMLLHDTMLNEDAHRTGTCESTICDCGMERESVERTLSL